MFQVPSLKSGCNSIHSFTSIIEQSRPWEANSRLANQEILRHLWNPKNHYRVHTSPLQVSILSQMNPVHTLPPHFLEIHLNIILPSKILENFVKISWHITMLVKIYENFTCRPSRVSTYISSGTIQIFTEAKNVSNKNFILMSILNTDSRLPLHKQHSHTTYYNTYEILYNPRIDPALVSVS
jgi:hypothetical protein